jgi:hypothetical protein
MSLDIFRTLLDKWGEKINEGRSYIIFGGGEPTLHPKFWKFIGYALKYGLPWVATNGSNAEDAIILCEMAKKGVVHAVLSQDRWHDPIDQRVTDLYMEGLTRHETEWYDEWYAEPGKCLDRREVRSVKIPINSGRAAYVPETRKGCCCPGLKVVPNGDIFACGCEDAPNIGTVKTGVEDPQYKYYDAFGGCYKKTNLVFQPE